MEKIDSTLSDVEKKILNLMQKDFGFEVRPFKVLAEKLQLSESELILKVQSLKDRGYITRVGPFFNLDRSSGHVSLVAMSIPEDKFDEVANIVNGYDEVAHNYRRAHQFNMWFVLACAEETRAVEILEKISLETGFPVMNLPKLREFSLDLFLEVR